MPSFSLLCTVVPSHAFKSRPPFLCFCATLVLAMVFTVLFFCLLFFFLFCMTFAPPASTAACLVHSKAMQGEEAAVPVLPEEEGGVGEESGRAEKTERRASSVGREEEESNEDMVQRRFSENDLR